MPSDDSDKRAQAVSDARRMQDQSREAEPEAGTGRTADGKLFQSKGRVCLEGDAGRGW